METRVLKKYDGKKQAWLHGAVWILLLLIAALLLLRLVVGTSSVSGMSMYPTLNDGQMVIFNRLAKEYRYGDIVSVKMPSGERYVKRIVGLPGDEIDIRDGNLYINGAEEKAEYSYGQTEAQSSLVVYPCVLENDRYFTLGDNREVSIDSRTYGAVPKRQIEGTLFGK